MTSISLLKSKIQNAETAGSGEVKWEGSKGLGQLLLDLLNLQKVHGISYAPTVQVLLQLSPEDAQIVFVKDAGVYAYEAIVQGAAGPQDVPAHGGGYWVFLASLGLRQYETIVGNGSATTFTLNHKLGTMTPQVVAYDLGGLNPTLVHAASVQVLSDTSIRIVFDPAPASVKILIKK